MSTTRTYKYFEPVEIKIDGISKKELVSLIELAEKSIIMKLEKLNIIMKKMQVYHCNDILLVNDRYDICPEFDTIVSAFGINVNKIACKLKGATYILQEPLIQLIKLLKKDFSLEKFANKNLPEEIKSYIKQVKKQYCCNKNEENMLIQILQRGHYFAEGQRLIIEQTVDDRTTKTIGNAELMDNNIESTIKQLAKDLSNKINKTNEQVRDGTCQLINARAKQMGYIVEQKKVNNQIQLVLVRNE